LWQDCESQAAKDVEGEAKLARKRNSKVKHMKKKAVDMDEELFGADKGGKVIDQR
jgi:uncharacterized protein YbcI